MEEVEKGALRIGWAQSHMPVLLEVTKSMVERRSLDGWRVGMAMHLEAKTAVLALRLRDAGAQVSLTSCNPLTTDDSVAEALRERFGLQNFAERGQTREDYYGSLHRVLDTRPSLIVDDGGDLTYLLHTERTDVLEEVRGGSEETTTGVVRLRVMEREGKLRFPMIDVNEARMKYLFDNRYGTGQSTLDGIMNATNLLLAGKHFTVAGYGWCGRGIALRARGMGAHVIVTEIDPVRAVEAKLDGFEVMPMKQAARISDFIVTATGVKDVVSEEHLKVLKDGCVIANAGHFDVEISKDDLEGLSSSKKRVREFVEEYLLDGGRKIYLLGEGRLINLVAGQGHPVEIMDTSFALQALSVHHLMKHHGELTPKVYPVPQEIDMRVAKTKLRTMGVRIDGLTEGQREYISSWEAGT
ncbi:MAG: adenosylhomocysteinase [Candidatus Thermoplasmatota archaeon]|nr:adenosylhomocysteinase [Candidatus Thermoplasmatota archaeon]